MSLESRAISRSSGSRELMQIEKIDMQWTKVAARLEPNSHFNKYFYLRSTYYTYFLFYLFIYYFTFGLCTILRLIINILAFCLNKIFLTHYVDNHEIV